VARVKDIAEPDAAPREDSVDPELVALPAPPKGRRLAAMTVMALTVVASLALVGSLRADIAYFFAPATVVDLGEVTAVDPAALEPNTFVRVSGTPSAAHTVRYGKLLSSTTYAVFPLAGQRDVFVQVPVAGAEEERSLARREYAGRLVTFGQLGGRFSQVRQYLGDAMGVPVSSESFLILADEPPGSYGWALVLAALCLLFVLVNVVLMLRWFRPLPAGEPAQGST
jgi:hypothetical protein